MLPVERRIIVQFNAARRVAAVVLTAVLLATAGQGAASADPQWEAASESDPQWESAPLDITPS